MYFSVDQHIVWFVQFIHSVITAHGRCGAGWRFVRPLRNTCLSLTDPSLQSPRRISGAVGLIITSPVLYPINTNVFFSLNPPYFLTLHVWHSVGGWVLQEEV